MTTSRVVIDSMVLCAALLVAIVAIELSDWPLLASQATIVALVIAGWTDRRASR